MSGDVGKWQAIAGWPDVGLLGLLLFVLEAESVSTFFKSCKQANQETDHVAETVCGFQSLSGYSPGLTEKGPIPLLTLMCLRTISRFDDQVYFLFFF